MNFPNVVEQSSCFNLLYLARWESQLHGDSPRKLTDTDRMARCVRVTCFDCFDHDLQQFLTTVLELVIQSVNVADSDNWNNYADETERAEPEPKCRIGCIAKPTNTAIALAAKS